MQEQSIIRLVGCQGSIQFLTALNVLVNHSHGDDGQPRKTVLLVYDLFAPLGQDKAFFEFISKLATQSNVVFDVIRYLPQGTLTQLQTDFLLNGMDDVRDQVLALAEVSRVDEIYLGTNWQPMNKLLLNCFSHSRKICYGDSIGLHIPDNYFSPLRLRTRLGKLPVITWFSDLWKMIKVFRLSPSRKPKFSMLREIFFDQGFYITLHLADELPPWATQLTSLEQIKRTWTQLIPYFSFEGIVDKLSSNSQIAVLMPSNFFEAGRMTMYDEISAYVEYVKANSSEGSQLIIKPHPRDGADKLQKLKAMLLANNYQVILLEQLDFYFMPFELVLLYLEKTKPQILTRFRYFTFSTACLSINLLFGQRPEVGLGNELVEKYFVREQVPHRLKHERDLKRLLNASVPAS